MKTKFQTLLTVLCLLFFFSSSIQAQDPFFFNKKGMVLEYSNADAKGKIESYSKSTVKDINKKDAKNYTVTYSTEVFDKNKKSLAAPIDVSIDVVDGVITFDPIASMGDAGKNAEFKGTYSTFPSNLEVGQNVGDYSYTLKMMGMTTSVNGSGKVTAKESITTPAGSFDCYKVESEVSTKAMLNTTKIVTTSWYARGVGSVRTETYDKKGKLLSVQELVALQK